MPWWALMPPAAGRGVIVPESDAERAEMLGTVAAPHRDVARLALRKARNARLCAAVDVDPDVQEVARNGRSRTLARKEPAELNRARHRDGVRSDERRDA